jgi:hypothetical protein
LELLEVRKDKNPELVRLYGVKRFPTLVFLHLNTAGKYDTVVYKGPLKFDSLRQALEPHALKKRLI